MNSKYNLTHSRDTPDTYWNTNVYFLSLKVSAVFALKYINCSDENTSLSLLYVDLLNDVSTVYSATWIITVTSLVEFEHFLLVC